MEKPRNLILKVATLVSSRFLAAFRAVNAVDCESKPRNGGSFGGVTYFGVPGRIGGFVDIQELLSRAIRGISRPVIEIEQKWMEQFFFDPVMAAYVLMGAKLDVFQQARLRFYWFCPEVIDSSGGGTGKTEVQFVYLPDRKRYFLGEVRGLRGAKPGLCRAIPQGSEGG
jgi:hypothetical protein